MLYIIKYSNFNKVKILAIETSCDETAIAILEAEGSFGSPDFKIGVLANNLLSQAQLHAEFGGVYPNLAKREHSKNLLPILNKTLQEAGFLKEKEKGKREKVQNKNVEKISNILEKNPDLKENFLMEALDMPAPDIDVIAVTEGPGLEPALWAGIVFAQALGTLWNKPVMGINHMEGHFYSVLLQEESAQHITFPALALLVSGGHTELIFSETWGEYQVIGQTRDDAVGEAFDKAARILGLPYPGGPEISRLAAEAREAGITSEGIKFPRPMMGSKDFDFSYSGLKTSILYKVKELREERGDLTDELKKAIAKEFEEAAIEVLIFKTRRALSIYRPATLISAGGVTASSYLRNELSKLAREFPGLNLRIPDKSLSTDNAVMMGIAAYAQILKNGLKNQEEIVARGNLKLGS